MKKIIAAATLALLASPALAGSRPLKADIAREAKKQLGITEKVTVKFDDPQHFALLTPGREPTLLAQGKFDAKGHVTELQKLFGGEIGRKTQIVDGKMYDVVGPLDTN